MAVLGFASFSACTFNVQPDVPSATAIPDSGSRLDCKATLLMPQEFANREYVSSFEGHEVRLMIGVPAAKAVEALIRSKFTQVSEIPAAGDGTLELVRLASNQNQTILIRPRFTRLESSVRPFRYNIEIGLALDLEGLSEPLAPSGMGVGTAHLYDQSEIQKASNAALAGAMDSLGSALPPRCH